MLDSRLKNLKDKISSIERDIISKIENYLENLDIDVNVIELKRGHEIHKNIKSYEVHFMDKCLILDGSLNKILYKDLSVSQEEIEISSDFYAKLSIVVKKRQMILKMENKLEVLQRILSREVGINE